MAQISLAEAALLLVGGGLSGYWLVRWKERNLRAANELQVKSGLEAARKEAENILREAKAASTEEAARLRSQVEASFDTRRKEFSDREDRVAQREDLVNQQLQSFVKRENELQDRFITLERKGSELDTERSELERITKVRLEELQKVSRLSESEARAQLLKEVERQSLKDGADLTRHILDSARLQAEDQARRLICLAIQRHAGEHTFETTTATLELKGDDIKGRIIGREGRNIRSFEAATGITVLIDDTPNAVVLSGFDPVRREIAREAMLRLIEDGRIHPTRIEEVVAKVTAEIEEGIVRKGHEAVNLLGLAPMNEEIVKVLGKLYFRRSFSQNILDHSIEVAQLMALMAAELRLDVSIAKRSGLLHDIGKALNHEVEGSHAMVGAEFVKQHGENDVVVNAVASHHDEVPHTTVMGILVSAADAISASRPGARSETMTTYIKRLENLEKLGLEFTGVEKCFALQAGRELRIVVQPEKVTDEEAFSLARNIARKIEDTLQYPGQIRVTVVRETRCVEFAK